ncbi:MAG: hypothetical protein IPM82_31370 [Saprospiraceae bacterium]|nr:hypothetical protein [Saprospiraceae bacterium]
MDKRRHAAPAATQQIDLVTAAPDWDKLLTRNAGWFGGDGVFAIPMDGAEYRTATEKTRSLFIFSDSVVADTVGETIERKDFKMVHNCIAYLDGSEPDPSKFQFLSIRTSRATRPPSSCRTRPTPKKASTTGWVTAS